MTLAAEPTEKPQALNYVDIYKVREKSKEELAFEKRSKWTKQVFGSYNIEYIFQTIIVYILFIWFFFDLYAQAVKNTFPMTWYHDSMSILWNDYIVGSNDVTKFDFIIEVLTWWKFWAFVLIVPLIYMEFRKTISTHKDYYRVGWHLLFHWNAFMNYIVIALSWYLCSLIYGPKYYYPFKDSGIWGVESFYYGYGSPYIWLLLPFMHMAIWGFHDIFKYVLPIFKPGVFINFISDNLETATYYEFMKNACIGAYGAGIDLGFNLYDAGLPTEDYTRTPKEAQLAKFHYAFEKIGLQVGMRVMDIGCGMGDWLNWLKTEKGCKVIGLNITKGHADVVEDRGIPCLRGSWQSFYQKVVDGDQEFIELYGGKFDAITCWDTIEHYVKGKDVWNVKVIHNTYRNLFKFAHFLLDKNSECGSFWSSTLHQSRRLSTKWWTYTFWLEWLNCYIMNCTYNGMYPTDITTGSVCKGLKERSEPQFFLKFEEDKIEDYRKTSILCENHFGNFTADWNVRFIYTSIVQFLSHPHALLVWFNAMCRVECCWMWHVGGIKKDIAPDCPTKLLWQAYQFRPEVDSFLDITDPISEKSEAPPAANAA